jgi:hypothetical protein
MAKYIYKNNPRQRLSYTKKTKDWRKENIEYGDNFSFYHNDLIRANLENKITNLHLFNGIVDIRDIQKVLNPYDIDASYIPDNIPHHPIVVPKLELLIGEEINRRTEFSAIITNPNAISSKEESKKQSIVESLARLIKQSKDEKELQQQMNELARDVRSWQDQKEILVNRLLKHYQKELSFDIKFNEGFKDALLFAEEIYQCDIVNNEPTMEKLNPLKVHAVRNSNSSHIEDSDLIILEDHWSPGKIVDTYYEDIKPADIDKVMNYSSRTSDSDNMYTDDHNNHLFIQDAYTAGNNPIEDYVGLAEINGHTFNKNYTDSQGNIRVLRVYWASLKKVLNVKYYDEMGDVQYKIMSEEYIVDKNAGEESKELWLKEFWEGTKIGTDIFINMRPRKVQYNKLNNPSYCHAGVIGEVYNTNQGKAVSMMDRAKNYQYMYDMLWDRVNKGIQKNYGKILELDLARVPANWEVDKWLHFATVNGIAVIDSFKEGNKGNATGKLAGNMNNTKGYLDMETGQYLQQQIMMLEYIKTEMGEIMGISKQREGQVSNRETVGGVERSVNQSSHITEWWFMKHEDVKRRVLQCFIDTAKIALKGSNKKVQYILDDQNIETLNLDFNDIGEIDFGIAITSSSKTKELRETLKQLAQAFMQNGGSFAVVMDVYMSPSLADMRKRIERAEEDMQQRNSEQAEQQNETAQQQIAQAQQAAEQVTADKQADRDLKKYEIDTKADVDMKKAILQSTDNKLNRDIDNDGITEYTDPLEIQKHKDNIMIQMKEMADGMQMHNDKMKIEDKKIQAIKNKPKS